jgi:hypothetical protein
MTGQKWNFGNYMFVDRLCPYYILQAFKGVSDSCDFFCRTFPIEREEGIEKG